jgi:hypothetical protein
MPRIIWLAYERLPHPDAVSYPAGEEDARLVLELCERPSVERARIAEQLGNFLKQQNTLPIFCREAIPCRRNSGLYHLIPWRLAKWLSHILPASESVMDKTGAQINQWLEHREPAEAINPAAAVR